MKLFIIAGLLFVMASPYKCAEENEQGWENESDSVGYEAEDLRVRNAIADWNLFLTQSEDVVDEACIKISKATDRLNDPNFPNKRKLRYSIIEANDRMSMLSDLLLKAKSIRLQNFKFDENTLKDIESFKKEFTTNKLKLTKSLTDMQALSK